MLSDSVMQGKTGNPGQSFDYKIGVGPFHHYEKQRDQRGRTILRDTCAVDIIIPYHGCYDLVRRALLSIIQHTRTNPYLVTLVDDGSQGEAAIEFVNTIGQAPQTQVVRLEQQRGFGGAIAAGLSKTTQNYVCVMHSDCEVRHLNWMQSMGEALVLNKDKDVRMVCATSDNPGDEYKDIDGLKITDPDFKQEITIAQEPLPLYCFMCHRGLLERIGSLQQYPFTWYENVEFYYRMMHNKYKQAVAHQAWVHHDGGATVQYLLQSRPEIKEVIMKNRDRCIEDIRELKTIP